MRAGSTHGRHVGNGIEGMDIRAVREALAIAQTPLDRARLVTS